MVWRRPDGMKLVKRFEALRYDTAAEVKFVKSLNPDEMKELTAEVRRQVSLFMPCPRCFNAKFVIEQQKDGTNLLRCCTCGCMPRKPASLFSPTIRSIINKYLPSRKKKKAP